MRGETQSINIKNSSTGEMKRIKRFIARELVDTGKWVYISNTEFRAKKREKLKAQAEAAAKRAAEAAKKAERVPEKARTRQSKNKRKKKKVK